MKIRRSTSMLMSLVLLGLSSVSAQSEEFARFSSSTVDYGDSVTLSWGFVEVRPYSCTATGIPGAPIRGGNTGSHTFTATESTVAKVSCVSYKHPNQFFTKESSATLTVNEPKPEITIKFPSVVPVNQKNILEVSAKYHDSCKVIVSRPGFTKTFTGPSATYEVTYKTQGITYIEVDCDGSGGNTFKKKKVFVGPPVAAKILHFSNNDNINGFANLSWNSIHTASCSLATGNQSVGVDLNEVRYSVDTRYSSKLYTLTCSGNDTHATKLLYVPKYEDNCGRKGDPLPFPCEIPKQAPVLAKMQPQSGVDADLSALADLGINIKTGNILVHKLDMNSDYYKDLIVQDTKNHKLYVLLNKEGIFDKVDLKVENFFDMRQINSLIVAANNEVLADFNSPNKAE
ncbi:hypothetical protein [Pleionea sp. CnH1-48]|uniref:hypothetical protein n=1 Tax=Pleionea sp. CnH1-48 TaxID=2954494 RepID=UPI0020974B65|nr:hypothetical protein [Pleionea sp. CnH1-48]MCO7224361.1 hypothetical protein [Pleionea sp. CnH1-48]